MLGVELPPMPPNIRYYLAQRRLEELFHKWVSLPTTTKLLNQLLFDCSKPGASILGSPSPMFASKITTPSSPNPLSSTGKSPHTPPRSPSAMDKFARSPKKSSSFMAGSPTQASQKIPIENEEILAQPKKILIPQFYFPRGKPLEIDELEKDTNQINESFAKSEEKNEEEIEEVALDDFESITTDVCQMPKFFNQRIFRRIDKNNLGKINKLQFVEYYEEKLQKLELKRRCFNLIAKEGVEYIQKDDIKPFMTILLDSHPGLEFLKATPEFQERYAETVICRIYYELCRHDNGKITYRDFKNSNLYDILHQVATEEDINKIRDYFSYEHFYVLYCRFWELDQDHDFLIDKEDFSRYEGHALSRKAVDRIFEQIPRKFRSEIKDKMSYEDCIYFMLCEEDKTTRQSLEYWFTVIDLDGNGIIGPYEMEYFYEEQVHRLEYLNHEPILFVDILCQMNDMLNPTKEGNFKIEEFKRCKEISGLFFNCLLNLNKFIAYEQRDLFAIKHEISENPDYSEWDRFAQNEYIRLAMEEENQEDSEVFDATDPWDSDQDEIAAGGAITSSSAGDLATEGTKKPTQVDAS